MIPRYFCMRRRTLQAVIFIVTLIMAQALLAAPRPSRADRSEFWVTAYYPVWEQRTNLPPKKIDYTAMTEIIQFSIMPTSTGDIDQTGYNAVTPSLSQDLVVRAHEAGDRVLICLGGANSEAALSTVIAPALQATFIGNLITFVKTRGYDGIDIDMEPVAAADTPNFVTFIQNLRSALNAVRPNMLLTAAAQPAVGLQQPLFAQLQADFDQINVMTYDLSGPWPGFKSWYNSSLYDNGAQMLTSTVPYPSVTATLQHYCDAGVTPSKIGLGIAFYGYVWTGANGPTQDLQNVTVQPVNYRSIMDQYYNPSDYLWDSTAHSPYLSITATDPSQSKFISYDDQQLCFEKVMYARQHHFGGVFIFELGGGFRPSQPPGSQDQLLQSVKAAWRQKLPN
jgi:chitinase